MLASLALWDILFVVKSVAMSGSWDTVPRSRILQCLGYKSCSLIGEASPSGWFFDMVGWFGLLQASQIESLAPVIDTNREKDSQKPFFLHLSLLFLSLPLLESWFGGRRRNISISIYVLWDKTSRSLDIPFQREKIPARFFGDQGDKECIGNLRVVL